MHIFVHVYSVALHFYIFHLESQFVLTSEQQVAD